MPKLEEYCEVRTTSGVFRDWMAVAVQQSFDRAWERNFTLVVAEPSEHLLLRLKPGDRVDIALAGQVVIQEGLIHTRQVALDANRHAVRIDGFSKAGLTQSTAISTEAGGQFRGYSVDAIANRVLKPYGLKFRVEGGPDGWQEKFPNVSNRYGETPFDLIARLCSQRGLWVRAEANGDLVAGAKPNGQAILFEEGVNILAANCKIEMPAAASVVASSQTQGSDSLFGKKASEIQARSQVPGGVPGLEHRVMAEMPLTARELQLRTNMEVQALQSSYLRVSLTYQGWLTPQGKLWNLTDFVTVRSPMLFPTQSGQMDLKLWGYSYNQDAAGTTTTLDLVNALAFSASRPDGQQADDFYRPSSPAQVEQPT